MVKRVMIFATFYGILNQRDRLMQFCIKIHENTLFFEGIHSGSSGTNDALVVMFGQVGFGFDQQRRWIGTWRWGRRV
jgi:hypothetical protein